MGFQDRPRMAAKQATPRDWGEALATVIEMGWGRTPIGAAGATVRDTAEAIRALLFDKAVELSTKLLERWERLGHVYRI